MSRSVTIALLLGALLVGGAVASGLKARALRQDASWLMARGSAAAEQYAQSLEAKHADSQLQLFEERRQVLERAGLYQRLQLFCVLLAILTGFGAYVLYLYWRLRQQLVEASGGEAVLPPAR